ncbi:hypothetical protein DFP74_6189 [Nocardiopsis sp. Huas11]|uniref:DUF6230 family protein n=1 Tax=Nocardiopsis sp. Huas11 TaxID=2183912 RepID=UPI000EB5A07F|nr:DUF6230 family protein [Nocardiopsis sp. Huas11]RKS10423.1 hypothetical protein DFP74_6189 [Nocardiopsis sp. Huas11]
MPKAPEEALTPPEDVPEQIAGTTGTRWRRFALVAVPGLAAAAVLGGMTTQGLLAASFAVSGDNFKMSADELVGDGFSQYGDVANSVDGSARPIGLSTVNTAELDNLCMSSLWDLPVGEATLLITAGENAPVEGTNLVIDIEQLQGNAEFSAIEIGRDASTLDKAEGGQGPEGGFGLQSDSITVTDMQMTTWAVTSGSLRLTGLSLAVKPGNHECF